VSRTWMWGPGGFSGPMTEWFADAPGSGRLVQYFDKTRMEITVDGSVDPNSIWYVTNGLLANELTTGRLQLGLNTFEDHSPAQINVAGDFDDAGGPTYASFNVLLEEAPQSEGAELVQRVDRQGQLIDDASLAGRGVTAARFVPETNHTVASPFWSFMNSSGAIWENGLTEGQLFPNPFYATGFPISGAYWANVKVGGVYKDVLIQVFERRVLTYTPDNAPGWQVEAGNVGQHYYQWRYGVGTPNEPPATGGSFDPLGPTPLPVWPVEIGGQSQVMVVNMAPSALTITFNGPTWTSIELPGCPECGVLPQPPGSCTATAPTTSVALPPGSYWVQTARPGAGVSELAGVWTLAPNAAYGACFFVLDE